MRHDYQSVLALQVFLQSTKIKLPHHYITISTIVCVQKYAT